jgi:hypothetical protein
MVSTTPVSNAHVRLHVRFQIGSKSAPIQRQFGSNAAPRVITVRLQCVDDRTSPFRKRTRYCTSLRTPRWKECEQFAHYSRWFHSKRQSLLLWHFANPREVRMALWPCTPHSSHRRKTSEEDALESVGVASSGSGRGSGKRTQSQKRAPNGRGSGQRIQWSARSDGNSQQSPE